MGVVDKDEQVARMADELAAFVAKYAGMTDEQIAEAVAVAQVAGILPRIAITTIIDAREVARHIIAVHKHVVARKAGAN